MSAKHGIALLVAAIVASPLALGIGLVLFLAASEEDKPDDLGGFVPVGGQLRIGPGFVPAQYAGLIEQAAAACDQGLSPAVLAAQIKSESAFRPSAISRRPDGTPIAYGISQFIPDTWASQGVDGDGDGRKDPMNPADAIPAQGRMMCGLLRDARRHPEYNGSPTELALAGYNAGWGRVQQYRGVPPKSFAGGETYNYVQAIMADVAKFTAPDTSGAPWMHGGWTKPVNAAVTTGYHVPGGMWSSGYHTGIDFPVDVGTPVRAIGPATVVSAGNGGAYGNQIVLRHPDGLFSQYAHLSRLDVREGQTIPGGQIVGLSGNTGNSSGPHLHMEVRTGPAYGSDISPVTYLRSKGVTL
ncbi:peptidoglycan DD-metalloendopeptidase family protein [Streptomyces sp. NPDC054901]